jgi:hypothetical protein
VAGGVPGSVRHGDGTVEPLDDGGADSMRLADAAFVDAVASGDQLRVLSSYEDGLRSAAVTWAANESARTGWPVAPESL